MPKQQLLIIADDVTGAADSAARCHEAGLSAQIALNLTTTAAYPGSEVTGALACSTDSRFLSGEMAAKRVCQVVASLAAAYPQSNARWYKKIDSTLRGNIGSELQAMLPLVTPAGNHAYALICPAFPAQERTIVDGYLVFAQLPPRSIHLPTLLQEQSNLQVGTVPLTTIRTGEDALRQLLQSLRQENVPLIVADAETEADLALLCAAAEVELPHALLCGSAGLVGGDSQKVGTSPR